MFSLIGRLVGKKIPPTNSKWPVLDKADLAQFKAIVNATVHSYEDIGYDKCIEKLSYLEAVLNTLHKGTISSAEAADVYATGIREVKTIHNKVILAQIAAGIYVPKTDTSIFVSKQSSQALIEQMRAYQNQASGFSSQNGLQNSYLATITNSP